MRKKSGKHVGQALTIICCWSRMYANLNVNSRLFPVVDAYFIAHTGVVIQEL